MTPTLWIKLEQCGILNFDIVRGERFLRSFLTIYLRFFFQLFENRGLFHISLTYDSCELLHSMVVSFLYREAHVLWVFSLSDLWRCTHKRLLLSTVSAAGYYKPIVTTLFRSSVFLWISFILIPTFLHNNWSHLFLFSHMTPVRNWYLKIKNVCSKLQLTR